MRKRLLIGMAAGALVAGLLPGVASAAPKTDQATGNGRVAGALGAAADFSLSAHSGPAGGAARGNLNFRNAASEFEGLPDQAAVAVECIFVSGNKAVIAGSWKKGAALFGSLYPVAVLYVEDNGQPNGEVSDRGWAQGWEGTPAERCNADGLGAASDLAQPLLHGNVVVNDAS